MRAFRGPPFDRCRPASYSRPRFSPHPLSRTLVLNYGAIRHRVMLFHTTVGVGMHQRTEYPACSRRRGDAALPGYQCVDATSCLDVESAQTADVVGGQGEPHGTPPDVDVGVVVEFLSY